MSEVQLENVCFRYGDVVAADNVCLHVKEGEFFAVLGPSGSGKTTVLRLIAGFIEPDSGAIMIGGQPMHNVPPFARHIGFVFQNYALFPHLTVAQNVAFGLESRRVPRDEITRRVRDILAMVQLQGLENRRPSELSGGQQQRVALARALVTQPRVLLLDEPLAALDKKLRTQMQVELRQLQQRLGITTIFVTHDQEEAMTLADRIAVMRDGRVIQVGPPREVYEHPITYFVSDFLGQSNVIVGQVVEKDDRHTVIRARSGDLIYALPETDRAVGEEVMIAVRPEKIRLHAERPETTATVLDGEIEHIAYMGTSLSYHLRRPNGDQMIVFEQSGLHPKPLRVGQRVYLTWEPVHTLILQDEVEAS